MKKSIIAVLAGAAFWAAVLSALVILSSCTTKVVREVPVTQAPADTLPTTNEPSNLDYANYLNHVNAQSLAALSISDYDIRAYGDGVCNALDSGDTFGEIVEFLGNSGPLTNDDTAFIASVLWGAVTYLCPEYEYDMNAYINSSGF